MKKLLIALALIPTAQAMQQAANPQFLQRAIAIVNSSTMTLTETVTALQELIKSNPEFKGQFGSKRTQLEVIKPLVVKIFNENRPSSGYLENHDMKTLVQKTTQVIDSFDDRDLSVYIRLILNIALATY